MKTLTDVHIQMFKERAAPEFLAPTNIDDVFWYARKLGITKLNVDADQMKVIWTFVAVNNNEPSYHIKLIENGDVSRFMGIDLTLDVQTNQGTSTS